MDKRVRSYPSVSAVTGGELAQLRVARNMSQTRMAEILHVDVRTIRSAEKGNRVREDLAIGIARALRVPAEQLFQFPKERLQELRLNYPDHFGTITETTPSAHNLWFDDESEDLWHTRVTLYLPIHTSDAKFVEGRMRRFELPKAALEAIAIKRPELLMPSEVYRYLRDVWSSRRKYRALLSSSPVLKNWVNEIWAPVPPGERFLERQQLQNFLHAKKMEQIDPAKLPTFTYDEVSCWRVFVQMFPESIFLLEEVALNKGLPVSTRMALSLLSSTLANVHVPWISFRAQLLTARLKDEVASYNVGNFQQYRVVRQFLFSAVEAGALPPAKMLDFLHRHAKSKWELRLHREYYGDLTDVTFARGTLKKYERPLLRDQMTRQVSEYHIEEYGLSEVLLRDTSEGVGEAQALGPSKGHRTRGER